MVKLTYGGRFSDDGDEVFTIDESGNIVEEEQPHEEVESR
jgi:hypothetical protein